MAEDREAIRRHVAGVQASLYPAINIDRFPDAKRLIARFEGVVRDWETGRAPDSTAIIESVNEIAVADQLLKRPLTAHFKMIYEPGVTPSGQSIDFLLSYAQEQHYFDVKTIRPRDPQDAKQAWEKYGELRLLFPTNADLVLAEDLMGGAFWHFFSSARAKFLEHALGLERKIASLGKREGQSIRMVFCGDGIRWKEDHLEDFADFYFRGIPRQDDPLRALQTHYLTAKNLVIERTIDGFCYVERQPTALSAAEFTINVRGPHLGV